MSDSPGYSDASNKPGVVRLLKILARILNEQQCRWYLLGAQAVNVYVRPRMSADVDVTVELAKDKIDTFVQSMEEEGFEIPVANPVQFIQQTRVIPFVDRAGGIGLDVVLAGPGLEELFLSRVKQIAFDEQPIPVMSPEDLVVTKILAGRPKDIDDVRALLSLQSLDIPWIRQLLEELEEALAQSDLIPVLEQLLSDVKP